MIGNMAVGPKCAKRAGLLEPKKRKGGVVILRSKRKDECQETRDLFEDLNDL
jgi:hypothetical protein